MTPRMHNPALVLPEALEAALALSASTSKGDLPHGLIELVHLRASQINGCSVCVDMHTKGATRDGETEERLHAVAAWRDTAYFDDAERAGAGAGRVRDPSERPTGPGARRGVGRGRPPFRRGGAGVVARGHRPDQFLQPDQRGDAPGGGVRAAPRLKRLTDRRQQDRWRQPKNVVASRR